MSIKKLFDKSRQGSRNYSDYSTDKDAFDEVESSRNAMSLKEEKETFVPQVDYSDPKNFVKYGSAELFYSGALDRIVDYYPYDGSEAEKNEFYNKLFDGEKYVFDNLYPRYNGFAIIGANGVTYTSKTSDGYGRPNAASTEYISFKGGPGSGSGGSLATLSPNPYNNKKQVSNIYDKTIYQSAGLPSDYGTGTRESNLKSNFDTGVTVEFWLKKTAFSSSVTEKEVIFDLWNNELSTSTSYGRLSIELTGAESGSPFLITVQSGNAGSSVFASSIGSSPTTSSLSSWHHYALRFYNSGSNFVSKLYIDGTLDDTNVYLGAATAVASTATITTTGGPLNNETFTLTDAAGLTVGFIFKHSVATVDGTKDGDNVIIGVNGALGSAASVGERIRDAINASDAAITATEETGPLRIVLTQHAPGLSGNTTIDMSGVTTVTATNFTGGINKNPGEITTSAMLGRIGALMTGPSGSSAIAGDGTLSASIDDFRFWKTNRNARQIGTNYFVNVGGGANTDISNAELGVYYKFNEGITNTNSVDSIVLDYAGRVTNAIWTGYDSSSRNTGSAIVLAGAATKEYREPVVRRNHPSFINLQTNLQVTGSAYDGDNNASFMNYAPSWVLEAHDDTQNRNLKNISHIAGAYFDKLYLLGQELPKLRHLNYTTASNAPLPFASHLPTSMGLYVPELFVDASILERLTDRTDTELFENKLNEVKNLIYLNLYNNLTNIYKSKGTEKAIRNVFRCFNIDDSLIKMNVYNKSSTYEVKTNLRESVIEKSTINFNNKNNIDAVVYQAKDSSNAESSGYISGSTGYGVTGPEQYNGATIEADVMFPRFFRENDPFDRIFKEVSIFGLHTVDTGSANSLNGTDTTLLGSGLDYANFQVYAVRDEPYSDNVYFKLTSSNGAHAPIPVLTSSLYFDVYDESRWNLSVRIKPKDYPNAGAVSGSFNNTYDVIFRGVNADLGVVKNSFELTASISNATGSAFLRAPKRMYVGARRTNITGAILQKSDIQALGCRYWTKFIDNNSIDMHAHGEENVGVSDTHRNIHPIDRFITTPADLTNRNTLALSWNFDNVTSSNASGTFTVQDYSSGSNSTRQNYGWLGKITGYQHDGKGFGFANSSTAVANKERISSFSFVDPEQSVASNMINILSDDDEVLEFYETIPNYVFTVEKSMYAAISEEMINFFAGAVDFNNVIGEPVNRYRSRYKGLEKLREAFFERVTTTSEVEKFVEYYKWFDDALSSIISQLVPASADFVDDVLNVVESHTLERNKYETKFPTLEAKTPTIEDPVLGYTEKSYLYRLGSSPVPRSPRDTTIHAPYWKVRAERDAQEITSGDTTIDTQRETYRRIINTNPFLSRSVSTLFDTATSTGYLANTFSRRNFIKNFSQKITKTKVIKGGVNFDDNKNIHFVYSSVLPAGPVNTEAGKYVPLNVLLSFMEDLVKTQPNNDPKLVTEKIKRYTKVLSGRDFEEGVGYKNMKSSIAFPFNIISGSISTGYQREVSQRLSASVILTNLHNDVYGPDMEVPMQGPFTNYAVGGHQSRHIKLNEGSDSSTNRAEAWRILLGTCTDIPSGAIGLVGPDYPDPNTSLSGAQAYPYKPHQKAVYFRDHIAKRPVNIRNIQMRTGSTILGNYQETYQYVHSVGAYNNPRHFVDQQPTLPSRTFAGNASASMFTRTFLDMHRDSDNHNQNVDEYSTAYLDGNINKSIIINRFSAPGGIETLTRGYQDFRASEFSVYNGINNRNLSVKKPWQGPSGTISTPATNGDTTDIQVYDIHGKDYGLYSHMARHTARFGRDSVFESNPGASYVELPGMHKVHRNNLDRVEIASTVSTPIYSGSALNNDDCLLYQLEAANSTLLHTASVLGSTTPETLLQAISSSALKGFSWSGWIKFGEQGSSDAETIFGLGWRQGNNPFFSVRKTYGGSSYKIQVWVRTINNSDGTTGIQGWTNWEWDLSGSGDLTDAWRHYAVTWVPVANGSLATNNATVQRAAKLYVNGTLQSSASLTVGTRAYYNNNTVGTLNVRGWSEQKRTGNDFMTIGGDAQGAGNLRAFTGSIDEFSFWNITLTDTNVSTIYNGGTPCDLTASGLPTTYLWEWLRFESDNSAGRIALDSTNPGVYSVTNRVRGFNDEVFVPLAISGNNLQMSNVSHTSLGYPLPGCTASLIRIDDVHTYATSSVYNNFNIQHQIPRSTKQYAWINSSLVSDNGWVGFAPKDFLVKKSDIGQTGDQYVEVYNLISASEVGSALISSSVSFLNNERTFGWPKELVVGDPTDALLDYYPQVSHLNTHIYEPINSASTNTVGYPSVIPLAASNDDDASYLNDHNNGQHFLYGGRASSTYNAAETFNNLMFKRGNQYGYPSWKQLRQADNPILRNERATNTISSVNAQGNDDDIVTYDLPPVSNRAQPNVVSFLIGQDPQPYTFKVTDENERIYYNSTNMDNRFAPRLDSFTTPGEQLIAVARSGINSINWVIYTQQLFPAIKNEFIAATTNKVGYDNLFWRDNRADRNTVNTVYNRSDTASGSYTAENAYGIFVSQSSWPLDAPVDFDTRTTCFQMNNTASFGRYATASAGQLQNIYMGIMTGSFVVSTMDTDGPEVGALNWINYYGLGPLYARKHMLYFKSSVKAPYGPGLPFTNLSGGLTTNIRSSSLNYDFTGSAFKIDIGAGEALWEAGDQAGFYRSITNSAGLADLEFVSAPSRPWFTNYDAFRHDLKLKAKGFSVVPEFRISEHLDKYTLDDTSPNRHVGLNLEIPHVSGANSEDDSTFFTTYTNSEFLKDFLRIKNTSLLNATQIRISCTGAIRFNPYKGFYPAQRTVQMVEEFKKSYRDNMVFDKTFGTTQEAGLPGTGSGEILYPGKGGTQNTHESRYLKPLSDALFSPGILFNTVKSGIAVDYPIVREPLKIGPVALHNFPSLGVSGSGPSGSWATVITNDFQGLARNVDVYRPNYAFFDERLPFETMLEPEKHLVGKSFFDIEANPFMQTRFATASFVANSSKEDYKKMATNFFGSVPSFFLKDEQFTSVKSAVNSDTFNFKGNETYMMRVVLERSTTGPRTYENEIDGFSREYESGNKANNAFSLYGGRPINDSHTVQTGNSTSYVTHSTAIGYPTLRTGSFPVSNSAGGTVYLTGANFPQDYFNIPQDPIYNTNFRETFTMYSRASAFGPDLLGGSGLIQSTVRTGGEIQRQGAMDSVIGINPAYTPPYTNGEAWCDLIFRPSADKTYTLKDIMAETEIACWRFDAGPPKVYNTLLITLFTNTMIPGAFSYINGQNIEYLPYGGGILNKSAMQITSSFNLFGIEKEVFVETDKFGNLERSRPGTTVGERWVIRSKFETPMLNFSGSSVTYPSNFGAEATPRGMWHQFGKIPKANEGVYISVQDIPSNWLQNHYLVKDYKSIYNNYTNYGIQNHQNNVLSLADLVGFNTKTKQKVGKLKEKTVLREAVVAIPYIVEQVQKTGESTANGNQYRKSFIEIPMQRYESALNEAFGSAAGDSFDAAGASVSKQLQKMQRYVLPPQFDFLNNREGAADPFVMYIFEFKYELDKDDLSYIWQNLAPRDYKRMEIQHQSVAHELLDSELLTEQILEENQELRWMVFKVKQKGQDSYWDKTDIQVGKNLADVRLGKNQRGTTEVNEYQFTHNWPYDYVSFVEMIKINSEVKFSETLEVTQLRDETAQFNLENAYQGTIMTKNINPGFLKSPTKLEYSTIGSLSGNRLALGLQDLEVKRAQLSANAMSRPTATQLTPTTSVSTPRVSTTSITAPSTPTATTTATAPATPVGGRADSEGNSGGGSSY